MPIPPGLAARDSQRAPIARKVRFLILTPLSNLKVP